MKNGLITLCALSTLTAPMAAHAWGWHQPNCLSESTDMVSATPSGPGACITTQEPVLKEGLFTFPHLGTRSYRVKYWAGSFVIPSSVTYTYATSVYNTCGGWLVDKTYSTRTVDTSTSYSLENDNLDERIDDVAKLAPMSQQEMERRWLELRRNCGGN